MMKSKRNKRWKLEKREEDVHAWTAGERRSTVDEETMTGAGSSSSMESYFANFLLCFHEASLEEIEGEG